MKAETADDRTPGETVLRAEGRRFGIATPHYLATEAGAQVFEHGGNAVDAAVAAATVLAVVYPHMCSIGGDAIALVQQHGRAFVVNGSGAAPRALSPEQLPDVMPVRGPSTITVPGVVAAWQSLLETAGTRRLPDLLAPAVSCARDGVPLSGSLARALIEHEPLVRDDPGLHEIFAPDGQILRREQIFKQPALAASLEAIAHHGADALYRGPVGDTLVRNLRALGCMMTMRDLDEHATELTDPLALPLGSREVLTAPPNSQGFVLLEMLQLLSALGVTDLDGTSASTAAKVFHWCNRDRDRYLADPRFAGVDIPALLAPERLDRLAREIANHQGPLPAGGRGSPRPSGDTVAVVAADSSGTSVSLIQSVFHSFGAGILDPGTGIVWHNRGAFFSRHPESPNSYQPGKRPAHTLMPVLIRDATTHRVEFVNGTMGGKAQPQIHAQLVSRLVYASSDPAAALAAPRWVVGGLDARSPDQVVLAEPFVGQACAAGFATAGLPVTWLDDLDEEVGHAQSVCVRDETVVAASDPRSDGAAACR